MKFTRDGSIWMVLLVGGLAGFLAGHFDMLTKAFPGLGAVWQARLELIFAIAGFVGGYLRMSPAPLSGEHPLATNEAGVALSPLNSSKVIAILIACLLGGAAALSTPACGPKAYHNAVVADTSLSQALFALDDAEAAAFKANLITPAKHQEYSKTILALLKAGDDLTVALRAWDPSQPAPANIGAALNQVQQLLGDLNLNVPHASQLIFAAQTVLSVLRGTGVLPPADQIAESLQPRRTAKASALRLTTMIATRWPSVCESGRAMLLAADAARLHDALILLPEVA